MNEAMMIKAREAKNAAELIELAKSENIELTEEKAQKLFAQLHAENELSDDELDNIAGGGCNDTTIHNYRDGDIVALIEEKRCYGCKSNIFKIHGECGEIRDGFYDADCIGCGFHSRYVTDSDIIGRVRKTK